MSDEPCLDYALREKLPDHVIIEQLPVMGITGVTELHRLNKRQRDEALKK